MNSIKHQGLACNIKGRIRCVLLFSLGCLSLGIGDPPFETALVDNNIGFEWYRSQYQTGAKSSVNCAPASIHMTMKYQGNNLGPAPSAEEIRNWRLQSAQNGGDWYWNIDVSEVLNHFAYAYDQYWLLNKSPEEVTNDIRD